MPFAGIALLVVMLTSAIPAECGFPQHRIHHNNATMISSNVTLKSVTLLKKFNWFFDPFVYFRCKGENETELPWIRKTMQSYNFTGEERWQPIMTLVGQQCKLCGIYQHLWMEDATLYEWVVCTADFIDGKKEHVPQWKVPNRIYISLECNDCIKVPLPLSSPSGNGGDDDDDGFGLGFWIFVLIAALGIIVSIFSFIIFLAQNAELMADESERESFIQKDEEVEARKAKSEVELQEVEENVVNKKEETTSFAEPFVVEIRESPEEKPRRRHFSDILKDS